MGKHAYLITAFDNLYVLTKSIELLDDERNDIFLHCDTKMGDISAWYNELSSKLKSKLLLINRSNVYWGDYSYTAVIMRLLESAVLYGKYDYYHLITGTSLPIKSQDFIHSFFDADKDKKLYFHINCGFEKVIQDRCKAYYPFINTNAFRKYKALKALSLMIGKFQILIGINRLRHSELNPVYNGWGWFSIPEDFARYCIAKQDVIKKTFRYTLAADEVWIHTVAMHSPFIDRIYGYNGNDDAVDASKHLQDWKRGKPYIFTKDDFAFIMESKAFWARKFDERKDKDIVDAIYSCIKERKY